MSSDEVQLGSPLVELDASQLDVAGNESQELSLVLVVLRDVGYSDHKALVTISARRLALHNLDVSRRRHGMRHRIVAVRRWRIHSRCWIEATDWLGSRIGRVIGWWRWVCLHPRHRERRCSCLKPSILFLRV